MKIQCIQHVEFEGLGVIDQWITDKNYLLSKTLLYEPHKPVEIDEFNWLIVMGGPMGIYDDEDYPWLIDEKKFVEKSIDAGKTVIGICLGAQIIADVLGARVYPNKHKEIGWFPLQLSSEGKKLPLLRGVPEEFDAFHWHGDTFSLPDGAVHLAKSSACENQAFLYEKNVLALQFHLEATPTSASTIIKNCADELVDRPYIQSKELMLANTGKFDAINKIMFTILTNIENG